MAPTPGSTEDAALGAVLGAFVGDAAGEAGTPDCDCCHALDRRCERKFRRRHLSNAVHGAGAVLEFKQTVSLREMQHALTFPGGGVHCVGRGQVSISMLRRHPVHRQ